MNVFSCSFGCTCANTRHETYQYERQNYSQSQHAYMSSSKQHHSSSSLKVAKPLFFTVIQLFAFDKPEQSQYFQNSLFSLKCQHIGRSAPSRFLRNQTTKPVGTESE